MFSSVRVSVRSFMMSIPTSSTSVIFATISTTVSTSLSVFYSVRTRGSGGTTIRIGLEKKNKVKH